MKSKKMSLPTLTFRRATTCTQTTPLTNTQQIRHASLLRRPHRPYTFTQLITLSDGSVYTTRTTSPAPIYKSTKDTRNHALWNPSLSSLRNVEEDEAGRLKAFRMKFGRGWDVEGAEEEEGGAEGAGSLMDLISDGYARGEQRELVGRVQGKERNKEKKGGRK